MKKTLVIVLMLAALLLTACADGESPETQAGGTTQATNPNTEETEVKEMTDAEIVAYVDEQSEKRKAEIGAAESDLSKITGKTYYVSSSTGSDSNDGLSPEKPWKTLTKVTNTNLSRGDGVLFKRGDLWRSAYLKTQSGVTYSAYGNVSDGKPTFYGSPENGAKAEKWTLLAGTTNIWTYSGAERFSDVGEIFLYKNGVETYAYKEIPSYINGQFVVRGTEKNETPTKFDVSSELDNNLEFVHLAVNANTTENPTPATARGPLYLRCDAGNPGEIFDRIEFNCRGNVIEIIGGSNTNLIPDVLVDNLCIMYTGSHAVSAMRIKNLTVQNCVIGNIGGSIQTYSYSTSVQGTVTRYGNGIQLYGWGEGYYAFNNYVYDCYDAGITHQKDMEGTDDCLEADIIYRGNLVEDCTDNIEYFMVNSTANPSADRIMKNILIEDNILRRSGFCFGSTRPNQQRDALIRGVRTYNRSENFVIRNNILDCGMSSLIWLEAQKNEWLPDFEGNIYVQGIGNVFAKYGAPEATVYTNKKINHDALLETLGDTSGKVYNVDNIKYYEFPFK